MARQQTQSELPNDAAFDIVEAMELVHHNCPHIVEVKRFLVQQSIQQNLGNDHQDLRTRIHFPVTRHQANFIRVKSPLNDFLPDLTELLIGKRDQRRCVVSLLAKLECFVECGFGDQRFAGSRRSTNKHTLLFSEPCQQSFFLDRVGIKRNRIEVGFGDFVALFL